MGDTWHSGSHKAMSFVTLENAAKWLREKGARDVSPRAVEALVSIHILPQFALNDEPHLLTHDLIRLQPALETLSIGDSIKYGAGTLFDAGSPTQLRIGASTLLHLPPALDDCTLAFPAAARHLLEAAAPGVSDIRGERFRAPYLGKSEVDTHDPTIASLVVAQIDAVNRSSRVRSSQFASSASYMGSKRSLSGFLVAAIQKHLSTKGMVVDLMCGSGAAAAAFARNWDTIASDAQHFSKILAAVQGGGYSAARADRVLGTVLPLAREHSLQLRELVGDFLRWEDRVFHGDIGGGAFQEYRNFTEAFPTYPRGAAQGKWDPLSEVAARKSDYRREPFCLFTAYFANTYFGLRQCIEIDSLRFAISMLESPEDQTWTLGALIATVSCLGTTYGGHFAQPRIRDSADITQLNIGRIVEQRAASILHEFSIRFESLAKESELSERLIDIVPGPWQHALSCIAERQPAKDLLVYLDAPYKREEYSRYYHVLETLVQYNYPSADSMGRVPDKATGERFNSEFFSRSREKIEDTLCEIISRVLDSKWKCAWSYSDNGDARVSTICERLLEKVECNVASYSVPYGHNALGGPSSKEVTEYLIVFEPLS